MEGQESSLRRRHDVNAMWGYIQQDGAAAFQQRPGSRRFFLHLRFSFWLSIRTQHLPGMGYDDFHGWFGFFLITWAFSPKNFASLYTFFYSLRKFLPRRHCV